MSHSPTNEETWNEYAPTDWATLAVTQDDTRTCQNMASVGLVEARCPTCEQNVTPLEPDPTVFVVLYDQKIHNALALAGAPVAQHVAHPHVSAINFKLWLMEYACKEARLTYPSHAVVKDYGPPPLYHTSILKGLTERQYGELVKALEGMFTRRVPGARTLVANWSLDVQTNNFNPIGHIYVFRTANVQELQELHLRGAFAP